jgi:hypothetical protein
LLLNKELVLEWKSPRALLTANKYDKNDYEYFKIFMGSQNPFRGDQGARDPWSKTLPLHHSARLVMIESP